MLVGGIIIFSLTIVCLTITQSLLRTTWVLILLFVILIPFSRYKGITGNLLLIFFLAIVSAFVSVYTIFARYNNTIFLPSQSLIQSSDGYATLIATGTIIEKQTHNRYLRQSFNDIPFFLYTSTKHNPGDKILLTARAQPAITYPLSLFADHDAKWERFIAQRSNYSFDFSSWQVMQWVAGSLHESNSIKLTKRHEFGIDVRRSDIQSSIDTSYTNLRTQWLVAGMLIGDRSMMSDDDYQLFIDSGIVHIIAVSWWNIVMLVLFLQLFLFRLPFYLRIAVIIPCIIIYALICWLDASVLRATIMGVLSLIALFRWKQTMVWRSLSIAYISMLLINPLFLVYDLGFIFSFAAVIGIVYIGQRTTHIRFDGHIVYRWLTRILHDYMFPSIGASMAVVPFLLFFTGKFNLTSIIANMLVVPLTPVIMIGGGVTTLLQWTIVGSRLTRSITRWVDYIYWIAHIAQKYAVYIITDGQWFMYAVLWVVIILFIIDRYISLQMSYKQ
jgi:ComEC/Rec2-related protein